MNWKNHDYSGWNTEDMTFWMSATGSPSATNDPTCVEAFEAYVGYTRITFEEWVKRMCNQDWKAVPLRYFVRWSNLDTRAVRNYDLIPKLIAYGFTEVDSKTELEVVRRAHG